MTLSEAINNMPSPYVFMCIPQGGKGNKFRNMADVMSYVCKKLNVAENDLKSPCREREVREARQMYMSYCSDHLRVSLKKIGASTGHDHTTVLHSKGVVKREVENKTDFGKLYQEIFNL